MSAQLTRTRLEDILLSAVTSHTKPYALFPAGSISQQLEAFDDDTTEAQQSLTAKGEWDFLPSVGYLNDTWFHSPALASGRPTPSSDDECDSEIALAGRNRYKGLPVWVQLPKGADRALVLDCAVRCLTPILGHATQASRQPANKAVVLLVANNLAARYLPNAGCTSMTYSQIAASVSCTPRQIRSAVGVLIEAGLWGVSRGTGTTSSRFYPLFTDDGLEQYLAFLGK